MNVHPQDNNRVKIKRKKLLFILYIFIAIMFSTVLYLTISNLQSSQAKKESAELSTSIYEVNNKLYSVPEPVSIEPSKSSGNADSVINNLNKFVDDTVLPSYSPSIYTIIFRPINYSELIKYSNDAINETKNSKKSAKEIATTLAIVKKFIEYNPKIDLNETTLNDPSIDERLDATKLGIEATIKELQSQNTPLSKDFSSQLNTLLTENFTKLKASKDVYVWSTAVKSLQQSFVDQTQNKWLVLRNNASKILLEQAEAITETSK